MSHKSAKKERKFLKIAEEKLKPILPLAIQELGSDEDKVTDWFAVASYLANLFPERPSAEFLPSKIENLGKNWAQDFAAALFGEDSNPV